MLEIFWVEFKISNTFLKTVIKCCLNYVCGHGHISSNKKMGTCN